jgi:hypothetical protein
MSDTKDSDTSPESLPLALRLRTWSDMPWIDRYTLRQDLKAAAEMLDAHSALRMSWRTLSEELSKRTKEVERLLAIEAEYTALRARNAYFHRIR